MNTLITTGARFADIDALACAVAYAELLNKKGIKSQVYMPGALNNTVTKSILKWDMNYVTDISDEMFNYVIVDCSNIDVLPEFAKSENILEIWDHRFGYEDAWNKEKIRIVIDEVGACATLIWEEFKREKKLDISKISANLLYTAIFSNTLNFKASVTTDRDILAFEELKRYVDTPVNWIEKYYSESEEQTMSDPISAVKNDTKVVDFPDKKIKITIGQIELWNSLGFIKNNIETIKDTLQGFGCDEWFMTAPSISEGKNYIFTNNEKVKNMLKKLIQVTFNGDIGVTNKLWLRKEILKKLLA